MPLIAWFDSMEPLQEIALVLLEQLTVRTNVRETYPASQLKLSVQFIVAFAFLKRPAFKSCKQSYPYILVKIWSDPYP